MKEMVIILHFCLAMVIVGVVIGSFASCGKSPSAKKYSRTKDMAEDIIKNLSDAQTLASFLRDTQYYYNYENQRRFDKWYSKYNTEIRQNRLTREAINSLDLPSLLRIETDAFEIVDEEYGMSMDVGNLKIIWHAGHRSNF